MMLLKSNKMRTAMLTLCLTLAAPLPGVAGTDGVTQADRDTQARDFFTDSEVIDQHGNKLRFFSDVLKDKVVLINVIFTNCQDACPMMTHHLVRTRKVIADSVKDDVWFVSLSTDPERDTPEAMRSFAEKQGANVDRWLFLTGTPEIMTFLLKKIRQYNPDINSHSTQMLAGTTRERHEWVPLPPGMQPGQIAAVLRGLAEARPG